MTVFAVPNIAVAATGSITVPFMAGSPTIGNLDSTGLPSTKLSAGTVSGAVNAGTWTDGTGAANGWHGTLQTARLVHQGPFVQTAGVAAALGSTDSGAFSGTSGNATIAVRVSGIPTMFHTPFTWTDQQNGKRTSGAVSATACSNGTTCAVSNGVGITFAAGTKYPRDSVYTTRVGAMPANSMTIRTASASAITPQGGTAGGLNLPRYQSDRSVVSAGGGAVPFVAAHPNQGMGTFTLAVGLTVTWDPGNTLDTDGSAYIGVAQYAISAGP